MSVVAYKGVVVNGQVQLPADAVLPEKALVYVVVPEAVSASESSVTVIDVPFPRQPARILSPRLAHPEQSADFVKKFSLEIVVETGQAND